MDWSFQICLLVICVFQSLLAFNIDPTPWKDFTLNTDTAFGYKVIQKNASRLIVSDPLIQNQNQRGQVYSCNIMDNSCSPLPINVPDVAINMSLGLSMTQSQWSPTIAVCGPTIPKDCSHLTTYNGMCFTIDSNNAPSGPIPGKLRDCPPPPYVDLAFLLDGSGSISPSDFITMKHFVVTLIEGLQDRDFRFAVAQYSYYCEIHINFSQFPDLNKTANITQFRSSTNTGKAINKLVNELFASQARSYTNKVLLVITDGQSSWGDDNLGLAAENAQRNNITCYAIGVGSAFNTPSAVQELKTIASDPDEKYVFKVDGFAVLNQIRKTLETNIITIEGTQTGDSSKMEFAQDGFNTAFAPNGSIIMSAVGAYQWKGGYQYMNDFKMGSSSDSYFGYSMTVARTTLGTYVIQGAPRAEHKGKVLLSSLQTGSNYSMDSPEPQIGSYYGAEVCTVDLNSDGNADLLLVSAPLYHEADQEGKVFVYTFLHWHLADALIPERLPKVLRQSKNHRRRTQIQLIHFRKDKKSLQVEHKQTLRGMPGQRGRFGLTLASPADLNGDRLADVVVGAPLEENGQGSIYIFSGRGEDISPTYSQRISGSSVRPGLLFFGLSLGQFALDHSGDNLTELAVGSKGAVIILRSRPIVSLVTQVTYKPSKIPINDTDCTTPLNITLNLCFILSGNYSVTNGCSIYISSVDYIHYMAKNLAADINYTLKLDAKRQSYRAFFSPKERVQSAMMKVTLIKKCTDHVFFVEDCPKDALNPVINELAFTFEGLPNSQMNNLTPVLHPSIKNTSDYNLDFEINCGSDMICVDNLKVDLNFNVSSDIIVGLMQEMNVTVIVENREENSYNSHIILEYPFGLSFRRFSSRKGKLECKSVDSEERAVLGQTTCYINKPIFKSNDKAVFDVTYSIKKDSNFDRMLMFSARAYSDNDQHSNSSEKSVNKSISVKYGIYVALIRHDNSSVHINFTAGKNDLQKPIQQILKVENDIRDLNFTIFIRVPIKLGDKDIWANKNMQIQGCFGEKDEKPTNSDFVAALKKQPEVNCSVAECRVFRCDAIFMRRETKFYSISGNVSSGWIEQTGLRTMIFELVSTATLEYNKTKYVYISSDSLYTSPTRKIITQVEVYEEEFPLKETIGGAVGGLVILALITACLYKAGFFKSNYKKMLEEANANKAGGGPGGNPATHQ